jgi:tetratricopeptide (TPR) repeat protein
LGMAYSDVGQFDRSIELLNRLLQHEPKNVNGRVALGVALMRNNQEARALQELKASVQDDPDNSWAHRNLGALLAKAGKLEDALPHMRKAAELNPDDQRAWYGLGQVLEEIGKREEADNAYRKTVDLDEFTDVAELARQARSRIAQKTFRSVTPQMERMDAVMYLLGALEKFEGMPPEEIQQVGFEIAMLGTKGLDVNDPTPKYQIRTLPGTFSGLHLVCYEYAAFKEFAPEMDIGFDLSAEYRSARALFQKKKGKKE